MNSEDYASTGQPAARSLNKDDYKTLGLSSLGGTLEFYDFVIFVFFTGTLTNLFFPGDNAFIAQMKTLGIFAAGYLVRPIGGIIMAHYGDKIGRKRMFALSIFLMAFPTFVIGLLPTYYTAGAIAPLLLLLMRVLQGAAIGGEMPGAWVFIAEHTPKQRYGLGLGILTSGIAGGILLGSIVAILIQYSFTQEQIQNYAWRIPFLMGGFFGFVSVYLRRFLQETPIFKEMAKKHALAKELPLLTVIKEHKLACVITGLLTWSLSTTIVVTILMTPTVVLEKIYGIDRILSLKANCVGTLMLTLGCGLWGWASDKVGTRWVHVLSWGGLILSSCYFYGNLSSTIQPHILILNYGIMGIFAGATSTMPIAAVRAFPPKIRFTGLSFAYNLAYAIFGGLTPMITGYWLSHSAMAPAYYVSFTALIAIVITLIPLTRNGWGQDNKN